MLKIIQNWLKPPEYAHRPQRSFSCLARLLILAVISVLLMEAWFLPDDYAAEQDEYQAAMRMQAAAAALKQYRQELGIPLDQALDPNQTGLIGLDYSDLTTTVGSLTAKRTACNPAFAGIMVRLLRQAGCQKGDQVAITLTGSFPSLNIAILAACESLGLEARIISSVGSSSYGANIPGFTWLEMEKYLYVSGILPYYATAVSYGGVVETGGGLDGTGLDLAAMAAAKHGAPLLEEGDYQDVERSTLRRKAILDAAGRPACYINSGGGLTALGWLPEAARLENGLLSKIPASRNPDRGLIFRYMEEGVPVIHLLNIERLAERYALPVDPIPLPEAASALEPGAHTARYVLRALILLLWLGLSLALFYRESNVDPRKYQAKP